MSGLDNNTENIQKYEMSLEYLVILKRKEVLENKKRGKEHFKVTAAIPPMAKVETIWATAIISDDNTKNTVSILESLIIKWTSKEMSK